VGWNSFWGNLFPYIERQNEYNAAAGSGAIWGRSPPCNTPIKGYLCPSDTTHNNGLCTTGAGGGWSATSYAPNYYMFGLSQTQDPAFNVTIVQSQFKIGNIPDGTSNTVGVVERFAGTTAYGSWSNSVLYPEGGNWGWNSDGSVYGYWGMYLPQVNAKQNQPSGACGGGQQCSAYPYSPNSAHSAMQTLLMDGSVRGVTGSLSQATWNNAVQPNDGNVLGSNW
jgi:hypothetical protein